MAVYSAGVKELISEHCYDGLKDAVDKDHLTEKQLVQFACKISLEVKRVVTEDIKKNGYGRDTIDTMLGEWYQRYHGDIDKQMSFARIVNILRSPDIAKSALAVELTKAHENLLAQSDTVTNMETEKLSEEAYDVAHPLTDKNEFSPRKKDFLVKSGGQPSNIPERKTFVQEVKRGFKTQKEKWVKSLRKSESERQKSDRAIRTRRGRPR